MLEYQDNLENMQTIQNKSCNILKLIMVITNLQKKTTIKLHSADGVPKVSII